MEIRFLPHAVERMQERKISPSEVELILSSPDGRIRQSRDKEIFYKKLPGRDDNLVAAVAVNKSYKNVIEVITVMVNFEVRK